MLSHRLACLLVLVFPLRAHTLGLHEEFLQAAKQGETEKVVVLLAQGADVHATGPDGDTALMQASVNGHTETVKALLGAGADVNARDSHGVTALFVAAAEGHTDLVHLLVDRGSPVNAVAQLGLTALLVAAAEGHTDIVRVLLDEGAEVNVKSDNGATPLILAAVNGPHGVVVSTLLAANADLDDLLGLLTSPEPAVRVRATMALAMAELGPYGKRALPGMTDALKDKNLNVRYWAAVALQNLGPEAEPAVPQLIEALKTHPEITPGLQGPLRYYADTRWEAAEALGAIGPAAAAAVPALQKALQGREGRSPSGGSGGARQNSGEEPRRLDFHPHLIQKEQLTAYSSHRERRIQSKLNSESGEAERSSKR